MRTRVIKTSIKSKEPGIRVYRNRITFNAIFCKIANLYENRYVSIYFDDETRELAFEFKCQPDTDDYKLIMAGGGKTLTISSTEINRKAWVKAVAELIRKPAFPAKKEDKMWVITLCPAFEISVARADANKIPSNLKGIYRYLNGNEIVYIGRGVVRSRLSETQRAGWKFDVIQFSETENGEYWESYWLSQYTKENGGLPIYNMIMGTAIPELAEDVV